MLVPDRCWTRLVLWGRLCTVKLVYYRRKFSTGEIPLLAQKWEQTNRPILYQLNKCNILSIFSKYYLNGNVRQMIDIKYSNNTIFGSLVSQAIPIQPTMHFCVGHSRPTMFYISLVCIYIYIQGQKDIKLPVAFLGIPATGYVQHIQVCTLYRMCTTE